MDIRAMLVEGRVEVEVWNADGVLFVDRCDPRSSTSRKRLIAAAQKQVPAIDGAQLEREILNAKPAVPPEKGDCKEDPSAEGDAALLTMPQDVRDDAYAMLRDPRLLHTVGHDVAALGVVGEFEQLLTIYALAVSRLLDRPFSAVTQGSSSSGKSYVANAVSELVPPEAKLVAHSLTPNALFFMKPGSLRHRVVFAGERRRSEDDSTADATKALREMLADQQLRKALTVKKPDGNGFETQLIVQQGPIAYHETTTKADIFSEDANRMLLLASDDSPDQTRAVLGAIAHAAADPRSPTERQRIVDRHHAAQRMLRRVQVAIPFAAALADAMPVGKAEARRAIGQVLSVVAALACLHQFQRHEDPQHGTIINAAIGDYAIARALLIGPLGRSLGSSLPGGASTFAAWLRSTFEPGAAFVAGDVIVRAGGRWSPSAVYEYVRALRERGILAPAGKDGTATRYQLAAEAAPGAEWLPLPSDLGGVP